MILTIAMIMPVLTLRVIIAITTSAGDGSGHLMPFVLFKLQYLAGGFKPSEKYETVGMIVLNIWENIKHSKPPTRYVFIAGVYGSSMFLQNLPEKISAQPWLFESMAMNLNDFNGGPQVIES